MINLLAVTSAAFGMPGADAQWEALSEGPPRIECVTVGTEPWCRSTGIVELPIAQVAVTLEDMAAHQALFDSIVSIKVVAPDTLHVVLDFPSPMADRDYVARYTRSTVGDARLYQWVSAQHPDAPPVEGVVRLPKMAGEWKLEPSGANTRVTYTWQAEIAGSFPSWALPTARKKAGSEALKDIEKASRAAKDG